MENCLDKFYDHFEIILAMNPFLVSLAQKLRYQVYCLETGFEESNAKGPRIERDVFDHRSVHSLIRHRETGLMVATVRLVLPDSKKPDAPFPIEVHCGDSFDRSCIDPSCLPRNSLAEISRLVISKSIRGRIAHRVKTRGGRLFAAGQSTEEVEMLLQITLGLFAAIARMSVEHKVTQWYAVMEPTLLRMLTRFGIRFEPIGPLVDYHGSRRPCLSAMDEILEGIRRKRPDLWEFINAYAYQEADRDLALKIA